MKNADRVTSDLHVACRRESDELRAEVSQLRLDWHDAAEQRDALLVANSQLRAEPATGNAGTHERIRGLEAEVERLRYVAEAAQVVVRFPSDLNVAILNARLNEVGLEAAMSQRVEQYEKSLGNDKECQI